ncbi:hypothetical protein BKA61DRAFT_485012, partial [Leptodontidium sp. MPI-SDFR-AT-0119]
QVDSLVEKYGSKTFRFAFDVRNNEEVRDVVKVSHERFGRIDVVVNNAGYTNAVDTNFYSVVYISKAALPILR